MNISSIVIYLKEKNALNNVTNELLKMQNIEIITSQDDRIVLLIQSQNIDEEISIFRSIEAIGGVLSVAMIYSYQEELENDIARLNEAIKTNDISDILASDNIDANDIRYGGKVPIK